MFYNDYGIDNGHLTLGSLLILGIRWMYAKITGVESKVTAVELKVAEQYVTRPEFKELADKMDKHYEMYSTKIDNVSNNLITLTNLLIKKE